jgi:hypothetical protein
MKIQKNNIKDKLIISIFDFDRHTLQRFEKLKELNFVTAPIDNKS